MVPVWNKMLPSSRLCGNRVTENHWNLFFLFFRILQRNKIKSITKKAFEGLEELEHLWVKPPHNPVSLHHYTRVSQGSAIFAEWLKMAEGFYYRCAVAVVLWRGDEMPFWWNHITGVSEPYFCPLCRDLSKNGIMSIHPEALSHTKLKVLWVVKKWI